MVHEAQNLPARLLEKLRKLSNFVRANNPRLRNVGWCDDPRFGSDAFAAIYQHTGGIPRKINILCERLLLLGRLEQELAVAGKEMAEAINELRRELAPADLRVGEEGGR